MIRNIALCYLLFLYEAAALNILIISDNSTLDLVEAVKSGLTAVVNTNHAYTILQSDSGQFLDSVCILNFNTIDAMIDISPSIVGSEDLAKYINAPLITTKDWTSFNQQSQIIPPSVSSSSTDYIQSVVTFINSLNSTIESMLILFSSNFGNSLLFPSLNTNSFVPVFMKEINSTNIAEAIDFIKQLRVSEIILASELSLAQMVVKESISKGTLNGVYHWYLVTLDLQPFTCTDCGTGNLLLFQKIVANAAAYQNMKTKYPAFANHPRMINILYAYEAGYLLGHIYNKAKQTSKWIEPKSNFTCWNSSISAADYLRYTMSNDILKSINEVGIVGRFMFNGTLQNQYSEIMISEFVAPNVVTNKVKWTKTGGLDKYNVSITVLSKKQLKILLIPEPPFVFKLANNTFEGYSIDIVAKLAEAMNFDYTFYEQTDGQYGAVLDNGTFTGLIGSIASKQYDMAVGAITITSERERVVDFSIPYYDYAAIQILMKKVQGSTKGDQAFFLKAFTWDVWATVIATIIGTGFLICFVDRVSPFSFQNRLKTNEIREGEADGKIFSIKESMWFVLGAYTQAGESFDPRSISCRVIVVGLWLFAYLMMAMYTANLSAQLTVAKLTSRPSTLEQLAAQQKIKYSTQSNTSMHDYFFRMMKAEEDIFKFWTEKGINNLDKPKEAALMSTWKYPIEERYTNMYNRMKIWGFSSTVEETINKIRNEDWAYFLETPIIKYYTTKNCDLVAVGEPFSQRPYGIVLQNNSPLLNDLNLRILILQRDRILEQLKVKWWNSAKAVCATEDSSAGLGLDTLGGAFLFLAVGIGIAGLIFIGEKVVAKVWGVEWAKAGGTDPTVVRPMGMMSTVNVNLGSHISIRRNSRLSNNESIRKSHNRLSTINSNDNIKSHPTERNGDLEKNESNGTTTTNVNTNGVFNDAFADDNNNKPQTNQSHI